MAAPTGLSFSPLQQQQQPGAQGGRNTTSPVQDAIKLLSFRLPTVLGAGAGSPAQNLGQTAFGSMIPGFPRAGLPGVPGVPGMSPSPTMGDQPQPFTSPSQLFPGIPTSSLPVGVIFDPNAGAKTPNDPTVKIGNPTSPIDFTNPTGGNVGTGPTQPTQPVGGMNFGNVFARR